MCLNEMQLGVPIPTMLSVLGAQRMGYNNYLEAACYCKRYTAHEALSANLIDYSAPLESLADKTIEVAKHYAEINAYPDALHLTKEGIYSEVIDLSTKTTPSEMAAERIFAFTQAQEQTRDK